MKTSNYLVVLGGGVYLLFLITSMYNVTWDQIHHKFMWGMYDTHGQSLVITEQEFIMILEDTVQTFVKKIGSPKLRTFYHYERHKENYVELFSARLDQKHKRILDHIKNQCFTINKTQPVSGAVYNCELLPHSLLYTSLVDKLCLDTDPLLLLHPLTYFVVQYLKEIKDQMSGKQGIITGDGVKTHANLSLYKYVPMFSECDFCGKKFGSVVTVDDAQEDLAYLVSLSSCPQNLNINLVTQQLQNVSHEAKQFWKNVPGVEIEKVLELPEIQADLAGTGFDSREYFIDMGIRVGDMKI